MPRSIPKSNLKMWKLARQMNRLMDEWMHAGFRGDPDDTWSPPVDVIECEGSVHITAEIGGMKSDDITVSFENNILTLSGQRGLMRIDKQTQVHQMELGRGAFRRKLVLPCEVDPKTVRVKYRNGLLEIVVPKPAV